MESSTRAGLERIPMHPSPKLPNCLCAAHRATRGAISVNVAFLCAQHGEKHLDGLIYSAASWRQSTTLEPRFGTSSGQVQAREAQVEGGGPARRLARYGGGRREEGGRRDEEDEEEGDEEGGGRRGGGRRKMRREEEDEEERGGRRRRGGVREGGR